MKLAYNQPSKIKTVAGIFLLLTHERIFDIIAYKEQMF